MYTIVFHEDVDNDLKEIGHTSALLVFKKLKQIAINPKIGQDLGNKANLNLSGYKKVYVDKKKIRIVYKIVDDKIEVFVVAVGKRDEMAVYKTASSRIQ